VTRHPFQRQSHRPLTALALAVALVVAAGVLGACSVFGNGLTGPTWKLIALSETVPYARTEIPAADQGRYTVSFADDGTATITADCNTVLASYTAERGGQLQITPGPATLVACPDDSKADQFLAGLAASTGYNVYGPAMSLYIGNEGSLEFAATE
jgi:heat shock protein HslJ